MAKLAHSSNLEYDKPEVAVYFGEPGITVEEPLFNGEGLTRTGCIECGSCMFRCCYNAKNTLDKNYLFLAQKKGAQIIAKHEVISVIPIDTPGTNGYIVLYQKSFSILKKKEIKTKGIVFAGGVIGIDPLLLGSMPPSY